MTYILIHAALAGLIHFSLVDCQNGCATGWYDMSFSSRCNEHCIGGCDRYSGHCARCLPGWYGRKCEVPCSDKCVSSDGNRTCDHISGECTLSKILASETSGGTAGSWNQTGAIIGAFFGATVLLGVFVIIAALIRR